ncbi:MAG TPA: hypothetical protein VGP44_05205 [Gemmatimonadales bacterium]|nr:hypothetical protein [Gemmatimonadales bacterium]
MNAVTLVREPRIARDPETGDQVCLHYPMISDLDEQESEEYLKMFCSPEKLMRELRAEGYDGVVPDGVLEAADLLEELRLSKHPASEMQLRLIAVLLASTGDPLSRAEMERQYPTCWAAGCRIKRFIEDKPAPGFWFAI